VGDGPLQSQPPLGFIEFSQSIFIEHVPGPSSLLRGQARTALCMPDKSLVPKAGFCVSEPGEGLSQLASP
jgi:hypothetical protein